MHLRDLALEHPYPSQETVRLGDIWRDPEVARTPIRSEHVDELREKFLPHLVGFPIISKREDGQLVVLNGSHRCEALRSLFGDDLEIDISLYEGLTRDQEVAIFERHHKKFLDAEQRDGEGDEPESHVWTFDIDDTITAAPDQYARLSELLRAAGDKVIVVTGHGPEQTRQALLDRLGFGYDAIVIVDPTKDGSGKAEALQHLGSWFHFDNEVAFGPEIIDICPVAFQYVQPPGDVKPKKAAKLAQKALKGKRSLRDRFHGDGGFYEERLAYADADDEGDWA